MNLTYPYPILPVLLGEKDLHDESYWKHLCNQTSGICKQSMHWSQFEHGGLFWASDALPFLGSLLRALLRDETYPAEKPYAPLRVRRTVEMEKLLNVALWKVGAYKQWCKLDLEFSEVDRWLELESGQSDQSDQSDQSKGSHDCGVHPSLCVPLRGDAKFFPKGIPKVFLSMKSEDLKHLRAIFDKMEKRYQQGSLPNPILFEKIYKSSSQINNFTDIPCLLGL